MHQEMNDAPEPARGGHVHVLPTNYVFHTNGPIGNVWEPPPEYANFEEHVPASLLSNYLGASFGRRLGLFLGPETEAPRQRPYNNPSALECSLRKRRREKEISEEDAEAAKSAFPSLICPITHELFRDPVVARDGQTYEREAIEHWLREHNTSPVTNEAMLSKDLADNVVARKILDDFLSSRAVA